WPGPGGKNGKRSLEEGPTPFALGGVEVRRRRRQHFRPVRKNAVEDVARTKNGAGPVEDLLEVDGGKFQRPPPTFPGRILRLVLTPVGPAAVPKSALRGGEKFGPREVGAARLGRREVMYVVGKLHVALSQNGT